MYGRVVEINWQTKKKVYLMLDKRKRVANNNKGLMLQIKEEKGSSNALVEIYDID